MLKKVIFSLFVLAIAFLPFQELRLLASPSSDAPTFARFAYFVDKLQLPVKKRGRVWATPRSVFEGPFHANDKLHIYLPPDYFDTLPRPFFKGPVSTSADTIEYYENRGPFDKSGAVVQEKLQMIFQDQLNLGVKPISLPDDPAKGARTAAAAGKEIAQLQQDNLVFLPHDQNNRLTGGIVVMRNLQSLMFLVPSEKHLVITFQEHKDTDKVATVEVQFGSGKTVLEEPDGKKLQFDGIPNGAIYVAGSIGSPNTGGMSGVVQGKWTVASSGDIFVSGNIDYSDTPQGSQPQGEDTFALIAPTVFITDRAPELMYLYATIFSAQKVKDEMAGTLFVLPSKDRDMPRTGQLMWWGNYIGEFPAIMGTFDKSTGEAKDGYDLSKYYDARLAKDPPPFFPVQENATGETHP